MSHITDQQPGPPTPRPAGACAIDLDHDRRLVTMMVRPHMALEDIPLQFPFAAILEIAENILHHQVEAEKQGWSFVPAEILLMARDQARARGIVVAGG